MREDDRTMTPGDLGRAALRDDPADTARQLHQWAGQPEWGRNPDQDRTATIAAWLRAVAAELDP